MEPLESFRLYLLRAKGQKPSTATTNLKILRKILGDLPVLTKVSVETYKDYLLSRELDINYINQHIIVIRLYAEFKGILDLVECPYVKLRHRDDYVRATMSDDEVEAFLSLQNDAPEGSIFYRRNEMWTLFWYICAFEGFRPGEAVKIRREECDLGRNVFILPDTKTGHRLVTISFVLRDRLKLYLDQLEGDYLFPPIREYGNKYMKCQAWADDFRKRIKRLEQDYPDLYRRPNLHPYSLRHTFGTRQADEDVSVFKIKKAMGHKRIETTEKYIHMSLKSIDQMYDNDRLAIRHKHGEEIVERYIDMLSDLDHNFRNKVLFNIRREILSAGSKIRKKYFIEIEAID